MSQQQQSTSDVSVNNLVRIKEQGQTISAQAMELTDLWGAMFEMEPGEVEQVLRAVGFSEDVAVGAYKVALELAYVSETKTNSSMQVMFTWHGAGELIPALRGASSSKNVLSEVTDGNVEQLIENNNATLNRLMAAMPKYSSKHMFSPEVASRVIGVNGAKVSPDKIYELAKKFGDRVTSDVGGRRGVSTQFIRSLHFMLAATS